MRADIGRGRRNEVVLERVKGDGRLGLGIVEILAKDRIELVLVALGSTARLRRTPLLALGDRDDVG